MSIIVKTKFVEDTRRFSLQSNQPNLFTALKAAVAESYKIASDAFTVSFVDEEGDTCIIGGEEEMKEAIRFFQNQPSLKLNVTLRKGAVAETPKAAEPETKTASTPTPAPALERKASVELAVEPAVPKAQFVADVTIPDGTVLEPGATVRKVWSIKNAGTAPWPTGASLMFVNGEMLPVPKPGQASILPFSQALPAANAGETVEVTVELSVPTAAGKHKAEFLLVCSPVEAKRDAEPKKFDGDHRLWVEAVTRSALSAEFVEDVTLPDGCQQPPNASLTKVWRVKNNGTARWPDGCAVVFVPPAGEQPALFTPRVATDEGFARTTEGGKWPVAPLAVGEIGELIVPLMAPAVSGRHRAEFHLCGPNGEKFDGDFRIWADVTVPAPKLSKQEFLAQLPAFLADADVRAEVQALLEESPLAADGEVLHRNIKCDGCGETPIKGIRYKCTVCPDFDLCAACEAKQEHPADHVLMKLKAPVRRHCGGRRRLFFSGPFNAGVAGAANRGCPALMRSRSLNAHEGLGLAAGVQPGAAAATAVAASKPVEAEKPAEAAADQKTSAASAPASSSPNRLSWRNAYGAFLGKHSGANAKPTLKAEYVADVTLPDGAPQKTGAIVTKTWSMKNTGATAWPEGTSLLYVGGTLMSVSAQDGDKMNTTVPLAQPGEVVQISVPVKIPATEGRFTGYYRLSTADGKRFGSRVWVDVLATATAPAAPAAPAAAAAAPSAPAAVAAPVESKAEVKAEKPAAAPAPAAAPKPETKKLPAAPANTKAIKYAAQLAKLQRMGFKDDEMLLDLIEAANGKEQQVIDWLVNPIF